MTIEIPENIWEEISFVLQGKRIRREVASRRVYSSEDLFLFAKKNLKFLTRVANTEPICSFLKYWKGNILILNKFNSMHSNSDPNFNIGKLVLRDVTGIIGLYYWVDADYPVNRSNRDYTFITEEEIRRWHVNSLECFGILTEEDIWRNIRYWVRSLRP